MEREKLSSRFGFIMVSAGCAIGLGNVWRFPYIVGAYGGAAFILLYLLFLVIFGIPIMAMEFSIGRAGGQSAVGSLKALEPPKSKWHLAGYLGVIGNYLLMMFYTTVSGWMFIYFFKMLSGEFEGADATKIADIFSATTADPWMMVGFMTLTVVLGFLICSLGLKKGVEKVTKVMMTALLFIIVIIAIKAVTLPGAIEGVKYYLVPDFSKMVDSGILTVVYAAMGQAFFTLSIGIGSMLIFGSYIGKDRTLLGESVTIAGLDTFVAFVAGLIIIPSCFANDINPGQGPGLIFVTLPNVFREMAGGRIWGTLFFLFMIFAAMSTVIAVFENIISFWMDRFGWSRKKACLINVVLMIVLSLPCALGFNVLSGFQPFGEGSNVLDLEDFLVSNILLPGGSLIFVLFCTMGKHGWGWEKSIAEINTGKGLKLSPKLKVFLKNIIPVLILFIFVVGIVEKFFA